MPVTVNGGQDHVRLLTLNVLASEYADWSRRRPVLADGLRALRPDIVALQEVVRIADVDGVEELLGPGFHIAWHPATDVHGVGAALASRWPYGEVCCLDLRVTPRAAESSWIGTVAAEVLAPAPLGPILVVHHKPNWQLTFEYERELQAVAAARFVEDLVADKAHHVVLLGDFDARPDAASIRFWTGRQSLDGFSVCYQDAWESAHPESSGHTFTPLNPLVRTGDMPLERGRRIDYVMVRSGSHGPTLDVASCARVFDRPEQDVQPSDHYGLLAELVLPQPDGGRRSDQTSLGVIDDFEELAALVAGERDLYLRYSRGPDADAEDGPSRDYEAGVNLPGLSVTTIAPEPWWPRPVQDWVARRVCKYAELGDEPDRFPWLLRGRIAGWGPDHEPVVVDVKPVARLGTAVLSAARRRYRERFKVGEDSSS